MKQNTVPIGLALLEHTIETYSIDVKLTAILRYGYSVYQKYYYIEVEN